MVHIDIRGRGPLLTTDAVRHEINACLDPAEMSAECAATIASWWQAPSGVGYALAQLASAGRVEYGELEDDIAATRAEAVAHHMAFDVRALDMLAGWAVFKAMCAAHVEPHDCECCGETYDETSGEGYCGLCPSCADATEIGEES